MTRRFEPIAVVGAGCVLPGALDRQQLSDLVFEGRTVISDVDPARWRVPLESIETAAVDPQPERTWTRRGGYVRGFDGVAATRAVPGAASLATRDPLVTWLLDAGRQALEEAGVVVGDELRGGMIAGNLSFPTESAARFAENCWTGQHDSGVDAVERFMSGTTVDEVASALGLTLGGFALDAACASSLYAIELACRRLHRREADLMLAGAVNRADDLFLHVGFCSLNAMSRTGRSRPFDVKADGLVPAEGAAFVALRRLDDAVRDGQTVLGVIRGIGLSNDGRGPSFLAPSSDGQVAAIEQAWARAGLDPGTVGFIECHATGTSVGDGTELRSLGRVFPRDAEIPIGSLKANLGHGITVAGVAGVLKVLAAFERDALPPTPGVTHPIDAAAVGGFDIVDAPRPWGHRPRRAAVSAFGFGGNNAHLVLDAWDPARPIDGIATPAVDSPHDDVALVALDAILGAADGVDAVLGRLRAPAPATPNGRIDVVDVHLAGLRFPPRDLDETLPQQLVTLGLARRLAAAVALDPHRTSVFVGMGVDAEIARYGLRWRRQDLSDEARDAIVSQLTAAGVVGTMPNIPANRVNRQLDARGPSFTVSSEERSGLDALAIAVDGLRGRDIDAAIVLATDLADEPVHRAATRACLPSATQHAGDAAVGCVVMRAADAVAQGLPVLAILDDVEDPVDGLELTPGGALDPVTPRFGHAHAASGLAMLIAGILAARTGVLSPEIDPPAGWTVGRRDVAASASTLGRGTTRRIVARVEGPTWRSLPRGELSGPRRAWPAHYPGVPALSSGAPADPKSGGDEPRQAREASRGRPHDLRAAMTVESTMPLAPSLPPVSGACEPAVPISVPGSAPGSTPSPVEDHAPVPFARRSTPAAPVASDVLVRGAAEWARARAELTRLHVEFVQRASHAERSFIALQSAQRDALARHADRFGAATITGAVPEMQVPAPSSSPSRSVPVRIEPVAAARPSVEAAAGPAEERRPAVSNASTPGSLDRDASGSSAAPVEPLFDREALEGLASGRISRWFGPEFEPQDPYPVQVRMPEPPMLLCDRVIDIDAEPATMKTGRIRTETDVRADSWYLVNGRMPAGLMIEAGQADLLLISWLGIDLLTRGERRYRLLGCELTWHDSPPAVGETLHFDIGIEGHARHGDVRLFFFNYTCTSNGAPRLTVREGQAGFFTEEELDASAGVLWNPADVDLSADHRVDSPRVEQVPSSLSRFQLEQIATGRLVDALGPEWIRTASHTRTPSLPRPPLELLERVESIEVDGGPWGRGYLRAVDDIEPDDWFFEGHFFNDPCMPGTLMLEGCLHAMAAWMIACGHTIDRDGWRFEPVTEQPYRMRCRGQVDPGSKRLVYEVFVREVHDGPWPTLFADLLCTVDGLGAFHCDRMGLRLVPDWPTDHAGVALPTPRTDRPVATLDGVRLDEVAMLHTAIGRPTRAFGSMYDRFDEGTPVARLPGPPYLCVSRIVATDGEANARRAGGIVRAEWDAPEDRDLRDPVPFAWVLEAGLQPCGWCAAWTGGALTRDEGLFFRNLDGEGVIHRVVTSEATPTLHTRTACTAFATVGATTIVRFEVETSSGEDPVMELSTSFGFFDAKALATQAGLPANQAHRAALAAAATRTAPVSELIASRFASDGFPADWLQMVDGDLDVVTIGDDSAVRLGRSVRPDDWFFRAHFFQDPVMPGSLGLEGIVQGLALTLAEAGHLDDLQSPRFVGVDPGRRFSWSYRGQVRPERDAISMVVTLTEVVVSDSSVVAVGDASLFVDGVRIYEARGLSARVEGERRSVVAAPADDVPVESVAAASVAPVEPASRPVESVAPVEPATRAVDRPAVARAPDVVARATGASSAADAARARGAAGLVELDGDVAADLLGAWSTAGLAELVVADDTLSRMRRAPCLVLCVHSDPGAPLQLAWRLMDRIERRVTVVTDEGDDRPGALHLRELVAILNDRSPGVAPLGRVTHRADRASLKVTIDELASDFAALRSAVVTVDTGPTGDARDLSSRLEPWLTLAASSRVPVVPTVIVTADDGASSARLGTPIGGLEDLGIGERRIRVAAAFEALLGAPAPRPVADAAHVRDASAWAVNADVPLLVARAMVAWRRSEPVSLSSARLLDAARTGVLAVDGSDADAALARFARWGFGPWGVEIRTEP